MPTPPDQALVAQAAPPSLSRSTRVVAAACVIALSMFGFFGSLIRDQPVSEIGTGAIRSSGALIDPNTADEARLTLLPRIGPVLAERIVEERAARGPFRSASDLERVRGIGPKTVERIGPMLTFREPSRSLD